MNHKRPKIAVCDDELSFVKLMDELLTEEGYDIIRCLDGVSAFDTIRQEMPELVILDIQFQTPDAGFLILDLLRLDPTTSHVPVIVCSAATEVLQANAERLSAQNCDILPKPFNLDVLLEKVSKVVAPVQSS